MTGGGEKPSSDDFDARLRAAKTAHEERSGRRRKSADGSEPTTGMEGLGFALRVGTELVTATAVGVAIGFGLDYWLGTKPWLMILFVFLGGGAGVTNVYRLVSGMDSGVGWRRAGTKPPKGDDDTGSDV